MRLRARPGSAFVVHSLNCNRVVGYTWASRHAHVKRVFKNVLRQYGFMPDQNEPRFVGGVGPDVCFQLGKHMALVDVTVVNPLADSYVAAEAVEAGTTLRRADEKKDSKYTTLAEDRLMTFHPLALSVFGTPSQSSLTLLRKASRCTADPDGFLRHMFSALQVAVQVGNARILMAATAGWWQAGAGDVLSMGGVKV